jgi:hypothetical protein
VAEGKSGDDDGNDEEIFACDDDADSSGNRILSPALKVSALPRT